MAERTKSYNELRVYQNAMEAAMKIFQITKNFPKEEKYSLVDLIRQTYFIPVDSLRSCRLVYRSLYLLFCSDKHRLSEQTPTL